MFKASDVKELRDKTGAGMLDCKKALEATNGNMNEAIDWLREKGISKAEKKASRVAAEGLCKIVTDGNKAVILEVNSETDFVAKNEEFTNFVDYLANTILANNLKTHEEVLSFDDNGEKVEAKLVALTAKIGEKLSFRRHELVEKNDNEVFGSYLHMGGKIGALVVLADTSIEVAKDVAMHVAAMAPVCATRSDVPADMVDHESKVIKEQVMNEGKPADIAEKMVTGRLNKFYKEICLEEQEFIKDSSVNVGTFVKNNGGSIVSMIRYAVGEGIEKKEENFADEVMSQINNTK
jgi:elongation factor Ts